MIDLSVAEQHPTGELCLDCDREFLLVGTDGGPLLLDCDCGIVLPVRPQDAVVR